MKLKTTIFVLVATALFAVSALAVPPGKTLTFKSSMGNVTFSGAVHAKAGLKCVDCHTKIFPMKPVEQGPKITMQAINSGKDCGVCHKKGGKAFAPQGNCMKCHKK